MQWATHRGLGAEDMFGEHRFRAWRAIGMVSGSTFSGCERCSVNVDSAVARGPSAAPEVEFSDDVSTVVPCTADWTGEVVEVHALGLNVVDYSAIVHVVGAASYYL